MLVYLFVLLRLLQFGSCAGVWFFTAFFFLGGCTLHTGCMLFDVFCSGFAGFKILAICHTLATGYSSKSPLPSLMVLAINSLSLMKNQKMSLIRIAAVSLGYSHNGMCAYTVLYQSSMLLLPC